jgi:TadE-like protein
MGYTKLTLIRRVWSWSRGSRGQSLVEFAITLPLLLLVVFGTVDLGRAFFQGIVLENAVKEGAFLGARSPECDAPSGGSVCADPNNVEARVEAEMDGVTLSLLEIKCFAAGTVDFSGGGKPFVDCEDGDLYHVHGQSPFSLVVPLIGAIVGETITIDASATSVVVSSFSVPTGSVVPIPTTAPSPSAPAGTCTVPDFSAGPTKIRDADEVWVDVAGFSASNLTTNGSNNSDIVWQSVPAGTQGTCTTQQITVSSSVMSTPTPTPTPSATPTPTPGPSPSAGATPTATPSGTPTPTPVATCLVPNMRGDKVTVAQGEWSAAGFNPANFSPVRPPQSDYTVQSQSLAAGSSAACLTATVTVNR